LTSITPVQLLRRVHDTFDALGARDATGAAAEAVVEALRAAGRIDPKIAAKAVPESFLSRNELRRYQVADAFEQTLVGAELAVELPLIVSAEDFDSFSRVRDVPAQAVAGLRYPLPLLEDDIKRALLHILGEPFEQHHSGAELSDIFTPRVRVGGRQHLGAFMLKGRGLPGVLRAKNAGATGNQVTKLARTGADVFVVQHVNEIDMDVRAQLSHAISYLRSHGNPAAVGSVWDGAETARVLVAYDLLDLAGQTPTIRVP
jgi:hypothetical protein